MGCPTLSHNFTGGRLCQDVVEDAPETSGERVDSDSSILSIVLVVVGIICTLALCAGLAVLYYLQVDKRKHAASTHESKDAQLAERGRKRGRKVDDKGSC